MDEPWGCQIDPLRRWRSVDTNLTSTLLAVFHREGAAESKAGQTGGKWGSLYLYFPECGKVVCHFLSDEKCFAEFCKFLWISISWKIFLGYFRSGLCVETLLMCSPDKYSSTLVMGTVGWNTFPQLKMKYLKYTNLKELFSFA